MKIKVPTCLYWSSAEPLELDLDVPRDRERWISLVLTNGTMAEVKQLDWEEIRTCLPRLELPRHIRHFWELYFARRHTDPTTTTGSEGICQSRG